MESDLLQKSGPDEQTLTPSGTSVGEIIGSTIGEDEIGAKAHGGSDGWDDWDEDE